MSELATIVRPKRRLRVLDDDADNRVLECGVAARADAIVTGDKQMLKLGSHGDLRIMSVREFLNS